MSRRYRLRGGRVLVHDRIHAGATHLIGGERLAFVYFERLPAHLPGPVAALSRP
jgi:hypothetical protein